MTFDGGAEANAIVSRLSTVAGGRVTEGEADALELERWTDGSVKQHVVVTFGEPIPAGRDRRAAVGEEKQTYIMPFSITSIANSAEAARETSQDVNNRIVGWRPSEENSGQIKASGGYSFVVTATESKPTQFRRIRFCEVSVGLSTT